MKAIWKGTVIAQSDATEQAEGNIYFPIKSLKRGYFQKSSRRSVCGWKGEAHYLNVVVDGEVNRNAAWYYPAPKEAAERLKNHVAFWNGIEVLP